LERDDDDDAMEFFDDVGDTEDGGQAGCVHSSCDDACSAYLSTDSEPIADSFPEATVMFADIAQNNVKLSLQVFELEKELRCEKVGDEAVDSHSMTVLTGENEILNERNMILSCFSLKKMRKSTNFRRLFRGYNKKKSPGKSQ